VGVGSFLFVTIDAVDVERTATFWAEVLGTQTDAVMDEGRYVFLKGRDDLPVVCVQRVPEAKAGKNRVHLDLGVGDLIAATERVVALGGAWDGTEHTLETFRWRTLTDPDGNEFDIATET
jgi:predicted enzyme related to lactoylglutathione lyase